MPSVQRVGERHPVEYRTRVEILTQDHGHLPQAGDCPDLWVSYERSEYILLLVHDRIVIGHELVATRTGWILITCSG
jgi:hypothetical protein